MGCHLLDGSHRRGGGAAGPTARHLGIGTAGADFPTGCDTEFRRFPPIRLPQKPEKAEITRIEALDGPRGGPVAHRGFRNGDAVPTKKGHPHRRTKLPHLERRRAGPGPPGRWADTAYATVIALLVGGAAVGSWRVVSEPAVVGHPVGWVPLAALLIGSRQIRITVSVRDHALGLNVQAMAALIVVVLAPSGDIPWLMAATAPFVVWSYRQAWRRAVFNVCNPVLGVVTADVVYHAVLGSSTPIGWLGWGAGALAVVTYETLNDVAVVAMIVIAAGRFGRDVLWDMATNLAVAIALNAVLGLLVVTAAWSDRAALLLGVVVVAAVWLVFRSLAAMRERYANLELLYEFTQTLAQLSDVREVLTAALAGAMTTLSCDRADLVLLDDQPLAYRLVGDRPLAVIPLERVPALEAAAVGGRPVLIARGTRDPAQVAMLAERHCRDAIAVPLSFGEARGILSVGDRLGETTTFTDADLRLLEALGAHAGVAMRNGHLVDQLRHEAGARAHQALHDALTGLGNRTLYALRIERNLEARHRDHLIAVMLMDLDGFKEVNDTLGHHTGDLVLQEVASRLRAAIGPAGTPIRLGGDEFAVVVEETADQRAVHDLAERILAAIAEPIGVDGLELTVRASIGVAGRHGDGLDGPTLLKRADVAMYQAKAAHHGVRFYNHAADHHTTRRLLLATELRSAFARGGLDVWYQPMIDVGTGRIRSCEALLRWYDPRTGFVSPDEFVPVAEQAGTISALTWWVLDVAIEHSQAWSCDGVPLDLCVNLSARTLLDPELLPRLRRALEASDPARLVLELTESSVMAEPERAEAAIDEVVGLGVRLAIDDFGTGYSSLLRLSQLPFDEIKIDKSFVSDLMRNPTSEAIVRSTIELANSLGRRVTAEGVEDQATWDRLESLGCDVIQGYHLARPMPAAVFEQWLATRVTVPRRRPRLVALRSDRAAGG
jgi:diguanylate cyclase (GGDEF)-like protein